jgi:hypothetical protein
MLVESNGADIAVLEANDPASESITETIYEFPLASVGKRIRKRAIEPKRGSYSRGINTFGDRRTGPNKLEFQFGIPGFEDEQVYKDNIAKILELLDKGSGTEALYLIEGERRLPIILGDTVDESPGSNEVVRGKLVVSMIVLGAWEARTVTTVSETLSDGDNTGLSITNAGSLIAYPVWKLEAASATEVIILIDGRTFTWENEAGMINGGMIIDTRRGFIAWLDSASDISADVLNGSQMPLLPPGQSTYDVSLTGGGGALTITYREAYL